MQHGMAQCFNLIPTRPTFPTDNLTITKYWETMLWGDRKNNSDNASNLMQLAVANSARTSLSPTKFAPLPARIAKPTLSGKRKTNFSSLSAPKKKGAYTPRNMARPTWTPIHNIIPMELSASPPLSPPCGTRTAASVTSTEDSIPSVNSRKSTTTISPSTKTFPSRNRITKPLIPRRKGAASFLDLPADVRVQILKRTFIPHRSLAKPERVTTLLRETKTHIETWTTVLKAVHVDLEKEVEGVKGEMLSGLWDFTIGYAEGREELVNRLSRGYGS